MTKKELLERITKKGREEKKERDRLEWLESIERAKTCQDVLFRNEEGDTPLMSELKKNYDIEAIRILLEKGSDANARDGKSTLLQLAVTRMFDVVIIRLLLKYGADVHELDDAGNSVLMLAIEADQREDVIQLLLDSGVDLNIRNKQGKSALDITHSASSAFKDVGRLLAMIKSAGAM